MASGSRLPSSVPSYSARNWELLKKEAPFTAVLVPAAPVEAQSARRRSQPEPKAVIAAASPRGVRGKFMRFASISLRFSRLVKSFAPKAGNGLLFKTCLKSPN